MALRFDSITFDTSFADTGDPREAWILYSTDDASVSTPTWNDATSKVRAFSSSRGRESELAEVDAGTAMLTLDNRTRTFDPVINTAIRPMNRWWIREQFTGETQDIFKGYAESYDQTWPNGMDAETVVQCADEFKILALDRLPTMNPPRDSYADVIQFDQPGSWWRFDDFGNLGGNPGPAWTVPDSGGGYGIGANAEAIIGEAGNGRKHLAMQDDTFGIETDLDAFDTQVSDEMTLEFWLKYTTAPGSNVIFFAGRANAANTFRNFTCEVLTTGAVRVTVWNTAGTAHQVTTTGVFIPQPGIWYHIATAVGGGTVRLYVNGIETTSIAWAGGGIITAIDDVSATLRPFIIGITASASFFYLDELAFYPARDLGTSRLLAHYQAGRERGFVQQPADERVDAVLGSVSSHAPRRFGGAAAYDVIPTFMRGQDPLGELRRCVQAETPDGNFFVGRDGALVFLATDHRASSPWNAVQATFDDDGTDLPYVDIQGGLKLSDSWIKNEYNVTRTGGLTQTASDATSISQNFKRPESISDHPVLTDADALDHAQALLAKYKDPMTRIQSLALTTDVAAVTEAVFRLDIGDRIRVFRTPPGGGSRIDQTLFVQKISVEGANDGKPWRITLGVSPV